ncbi:hypothetical protein QN277_007388 [Acacia crassicarpa]|uniref:Uncharacterized protein n=1 Tax=Acacia crassicarpa TaxID=499986 RepID=A0AAE1JRB7_9FABA|nr:hypothetical protein QN277_007388 [Acacia crassicarpa]
MYLYALYHYFTCSHRTLFLSLPLTLHRTNHLCLIYWFSVPHAPLFLCLKSKHSLCLPFFSAHPPLLGGNRGSPCQNL